MSMRRQGVLAVACSLYGAIALAQPAAGPAPAPAVPAPPWSGSAAAGMALTSGNTDTTTVNLAFAAVRDAKARHLFSVDGVYLRGSNEGDLNVNRLALGGRHQYALSPRAYVFEQLQYFRDPFKGVRYLLSPTVGAGYKLVDRPSTLLAVDGGVGLSVEGKPIDIRTTSGAFSGTEKLTHQLSESTSLTQVATGLWKMDDPGDALYSFAAGVAANLTSRTQLKIELIDSYKTRPPSPAFKKNDVALVTSLVFKY